MYIYNRIIVGLQNYYSIATEVSKDSAKINYQLSQSLKKHFKGIRTKKGIKSEEYIKRYGKSSYNMNIKGTALYPIYYVKTKHPMLCKQQVANYTKIGRETLHTKLGYINIDILNYLATHPIVIESVEYNDNRLSLYSAQKGKCAVTGYKLDIHIEIHHITPRSQGGDDRYKNLILITHNAPILIHSREIETFAKYANEVRLNANMLTKVNKYRKNIGNYIIEVKR